MRVAWPHAVALALWLAMCALWLRGGIGVPLAYGGDGLWYVALFRNIADGGWGLHNPRLGAPFGAWYGDFPNADLGFHVMTWVLSRFIDDAGLLFNVFFLLGFVAAYAAAYWVLRRLGAGGALSAAGAFAFAFLPYHFWRIWHLWLATYFIIPLIVWECVKLYTGPALAAGQWLRANKASIVVAAAAGAMGVYYAFFSALLVGIAGLVAAIRARTARPLVAAAVLGAITSVVVMAQLAPSLAYRVKYGVNPEVAARGPSHAQVLGLNLAFALTPQDTHRIGPANQLAHAVRITTPLRNENEVAYLGIVGVAGLLALMLHSLGARLVAPRAGAMDALAMVSLASILWATVGGLGYLFALLVTPEIRALNRISIVLGFTGIAAFVLLAEQFAARRRRAVAWAAGLALAVMLLALVDEVPGMFPRDREIEVRKYSEDREFVGRIEAAVPPGTKILTMPYLEYPEKPPVHREDSYALLRPYAHSKTLTWSYAGMRDRAPDRWIRKLSTLPVERMLDAASRSGFGGIYVEGLAMPDNGEAFRREVSALLGREWMASRSGAQFFIPLQARGDVPVDLDVPPALSVGFYGWEGEGPARVTWCRGKGVMQLLNLERRARKVDLAFELQVLSPRSVRVSFNGAAAETHTVDAARVTPVILKGVVLEPGENRLSFSSDAPAQPPGNGDPRALSFAVRGVRWVGSN